MNYGLFNRFGWRRGEKKKEHKETKEPAPPEMSNQEQQHLPSLARQASFQSRFHVAGSSQQDRIAAERERKYAEELENLRRLTITVLIIHNQRDPMSEVHGERYVREMAQIGLWLSSQIGQSDPLVVLLFALLHESSFARKEEGTEQGERAALFAQAFNGVFYQLEISRLLLLCEALRFVGSVSPDPTLATCWDAHRLWLSSTSGVLDEASLCTQEAKSGKGQIIEVLMHSPSWETLIEAYISLERSRRETEWGKR